MSWFSHRDSHKSKGREMLSFCCAFCWSEIEASEKSAGQMYDCSHCGKQTLVPTEAIYSIVEFFSEFHKQMYRSLQTLFEDNGIPLKQTAQLELGIYLVFRLFLRASRLQKQEVGRCIFAQCVRCIVPEETEQIYRIIQHRLDLYQTIAREKQHEDWATLVKSWHFELKNYLLLSKDDYAKVDISPLGNPPLVLMGFFVRVDVDFSLLNYTVIFDCAFHNLFSGTDDVTSLTVVEILRRIRAGFEEGQSLMKQHLERIHSNLSRAPNPEDKTVGSGSKMGQIQEEVKKANGARSQHYVFVHQVLRDLFFDMPQKIIAILRSVGENDALLDLWNRVGKEVEDSSPASADGLGYEVRTLDNDTVVVLITLPPPQLMCEAHFIALVYCPPSQEHESVTRFIVLERSVGSLPRLCEWGSAGEHSNGGFFHEPTLETFFEEVCKLLQSSCSDKVRFTPQNKSLDSDRINPPYVWWTNNQN
jgi:DNA-directed RNA polymerase subunit RPC12/RpoP